MRYLRKTEHVGLAKCISYVATNEKRTTLIRVNDVTPGQFEINHFPGELQAQGYEEISKEEFSHVYHQFGSSFFLHLDHLNVEPKSTEA